MRRRAFMTEPISCDVTDSRTPPKSPAETEFEKPRGISRVEVRDGFAQVHIIDLAGELMPARICVLQAVANADVSIDFLKLTPTGLSFLVAEDRAGEIEAALKGCGAEFSLNRGRSIVLVYAVNMRDEEGMIARLVQAAISTGAIVDHVGDMHDRLLMVTKSDAAHRLGDHFQATLLNV